MIFKVEKSSGAPGRLQLASFGTRFALPLDRLSRKNSCSFAEATVLMRNISPDNSIRENRRIFDFDSFPRFNQLPEA